MCVCASLPRLAIPERILIVQHAREACKTTNTGRLVHRLLENSLLTRYGGRGEPFDPAPFQHAEADYAMLYPRDGAPLLTPDPCRSRTGRLRAFILLDGTWSQAAKMSRRVPGVKDIPCYVLPPGEPGRWAVRHSDDPCRLATIEACARLLVLLGHAREAQIMDQA
ncbi:MAG: DTW domain-containing protein, partial [Candidatus Rokubacteria bacterium]|nr:DTW domain-containing protein [Candidatus Rokubacteria bacterium]